MAAKEYVAHAFEYQFTVSVASGSANVLVNVIGIQ